MFGNRHLSTKSGEWPITVEEIRHGDEVVSASLGGDDPGDVNVTMNGHRALVRFRRRLLPFSVAVPRESDAEAVAGELRSLSYDASLREALATLAQQFTASRSL